MSGVLAAGDLDWSRAGVAGEVRRCGEPRGPAGAAKQPAGDDRAHACGRPAQPGGRSWAALFMRLHLCGFAVIPVFHQDLSCHLPRHHGHPSSEPSELDRMSAGSRGWWPGVTNATIPFTTCSTQGPVGGQAGGADTRAVQPGWSMEDAMGTPDTPDRQRYPRPSHRSTYGRRANCDQLVLVAATPASRRRTPSGCAA
jgi:hypothetical protein